MLLYLTMVTSCNILYLSSSYRNGSVIANFTVIFKAVDSHEILMFTEISEKDGRLADLAISNVSLTAVGS